MKYLLKFINYLNESVDKDKKGGHQSNIDGRYGFYMFLNTLDELNFSFIKSGNYLNTGSFLYFFRTEWIKNPINVKDECEFKDSIKNTFNTYNKISSEKLCFYFGIRNDKLEYGFYNDLKDIIYKTGEFFIKDAEIRQIKSYKCLAMISGILKNASIKTLIILHEIKKDMKYLFEDKTSKSLTILTTMRLKKIFDKESLKEFEEDNLITMFVNWCNKYPWGKKTEAYIDNSENEISFYVKIKTKNSDKPITL